MNRLGLVGGWWYPSRQKQGSKLRPCMCCQHPFITEGIHNRLCIVCKESDLID